MPFKNLESQNECHRYMLPSLLEYVPTVAWSKDVYNMKQIADKDGICRFSMTSTGNSGGSAASGAMDVQFCDKNGTALTGVPLHYLDSNKGFTVNIHDKGYQWVKFFNYSARAQGIYFWR